MNFPKRLSVLFLVMICVPLFLACATSKDSRNKADALFMIGVSELRTGNNQGAFLKFQEAVRLDPDNKEIHNALGDVYRRMEDFDNAEKHFKRAVSIDKEYSEAYTNLCFLDYLRKDYDTALSYCELSLKNLLYSTPEVAYLYMGRIHYEREEYDEAVEAYKNALRRNTIFPPAYYGLALTYNARKMYGPAAEAMESAISFDPQFNGDRQKAEEEFRKQKLRSDRPREIQTYIDILHY